MAMAFYNHRCRKTLKVTFPLASEIMQHFHLSTLLAYRIQDGVVSDDYAFKVFTQQVETMKKLL
jgi:hypothetical protein